MCGWFAVPLSTLYFLLVYIHAEDDECMGSCNSLVSSRFRAKENVYEPLTVEK